MYSPSDLPKCVCSNDFRDYAKKRLPKAVFEYIDSGSEDQKTLRENQTSFHKLMIIPRILISSEIVDMSTSIFGHNLKLPFGFAPYAMNSICHPQGQMIAARVAKQNSIMWTVSSLSTKSFTQLQQANQNGLRFLQLYITKDWELTKTIIKLAEKYGFTGLCITVDAQVLGVRKRQQKTVFDSSYLPFPILEEIHQNCPTKSTHSTQRRSLLMNRDLSMSWATIQKVRQITPLKIVLKGIMHPRDAEIAINYCDAIYVSNHGGRQLDGVQSTINVLPLIKNAVGNKVPIFVDGGVRTGNDIFKCLALGANYVFVGRPLAYSMVFGYEGVRKLVDILSEQLRRCMILVGCKSLAEIRADSIVPQPSL